MHGYEEALDFLAAALEAVVDDPGATLADEHDLQVEMGLAYKATGDWLSLRPLVHLAIEVADQMDDPVALARVAVMTSIDALWQSAHHGEVDDVVVRALRRALDRLPDTDHELRCRVMMSLAGELYYGSSGQERDALAEEAVAMARRIGDPTLLMSTCQNAFVATWRPGTVHQRTALADEALAIAQELGDARALTHAQTVRAVSAAELGDVDLMDALTAEARRGAEAQRNLYALVVLDSLEIPWLAMRGEHERAEAMMTHLDETGQKMGLAQQGDALLGAYYATRMWRGGEEEILTIVRSIIDDNVLPLDASLLVLLVRTGRTEEARAMLAEREPRLGGDTWFSLLPWAFAAESALGLDDHDLAAKSYRLLAPHAGMMGAAGSGVTVGPVDAFLAMAAATTGEREIAARHAEAALTQCRAWRIPLVEKWFLGQRDRYRF